MSKAHYVVPSGPTEDAVVVRLGAGTTTSDNMSTYDEGKLVKQVATDRWDLCAAGDAIDGVISSVEPATSGGYSIGGILRGKKSNQFFNATADGLQATAGTGTLAMGDYVVAGTITAKGTALTAYPKVCKATIQPGDVPGSLTAAAAQVLAMANAWKVVSLVTGAGAVGTTVVIERV